mmetsp:Transcript_31211/g.93121  ORF Transcript_31211/g.93121 Transcript_31211/m.93121 type:complete len:261 (+) Transcript_31211:2704-3486(+)
MSPCSHALFWHKLGDNTGSALAACSCCLVGTPRTASILLRRLNRSFVPSTCCPHVLLRRSSAPAASTSRGMSSSWPSLSSLPNWRNLLLSWMLVLLEMNKSMENRCSASMKGCVAQVWCTGERKGEGPRRHASNWVAVELAPATHGCALGINISKSTAACSPLSNMYFWMVAACTSSITWELVKLGGRSFPCKRGTAPVRKQLQRRSAPPAIEIALLHGQRAGRCSNANLAADARVCDGVRRGRAVDLRVLNLHVSCRTA